MKRNAKEISSKIYIKDNKFYCKEKCIIEFPKWYEDKDLANIQEVTSLYGIFAIIIGESYSVSIIPTLLITNPIMIKEVERNGMIYNQFIYGKDDPIIEDVKVVKYDKISYNFFENFYMFAKIPWFIEYEDMVKIMDNLPGYAKSNVGGNFIANELTTSFITRNKENKSIFFRQNQKSDYEFIELMNVYHGALNTLNRVAGNYFTDSLVSAITQKETHTTKLEDHVRQ